jgi:hypothetical protein
MPHGGHPGKALGWRGDLTGGAAIRPFSPLWDMGCARAVIGPEAAIFYFCSFK